jgi:hypothetical protein
MQRKSAKAIYMPRLLVAVAIILALGILLIVQNALSNSVTGIKQVLVP